MYFLIHFNMSQQSHDRRLTQTLETFVKNNSEESIRWFVAQEALGHESPSCFFVDLFNHGCQSGMASSLIYHSQTHQFYDAYYDEIEELRHEYEAENSTPVIAGDLKNHYAWLAFEEVAWQLTVELELEV